MGLQGLITMRSLPRSAGASLDLAADLSNSQEAIVGQKHILPFQVEDELKAWANIRKALIGNHIL